MNGQREGEGGQKKREGARVFRNANMQRGEKWKTVEVFVEIQFSERSRGPLSSNLKIGNRIKRIPRLSSFMNRVKKMRDEVKRKEREREIESDGGLDYTLLFLFISFSVKLLSLFNFHFPSLGSLSSERLSLKLIITVQIMSCSLFWWFLCEWIVLGDFRFPGRREILNRKEKRERMGEVDKRTFVWGQISIRYGRNINSQIITFHPFFSSFSFHLDPNSLEDIHIRTFLSHRLSLDNILKPLLIAWVDDSTSLVLLLLVNRDHHHRHDAAIMGVTGLWTNVVEDLNADGTIVCTVSEFQSVVLSLLKYYLLPQA